MYDVDVADFEGQTALATPRSPAEFSYPLTLPMEIALGESPVKTICEAYGITRTRMVEIVAMPRFKAEVQACREALRRDGMSFKVKARAMSEEFLKKIFKMVHEPHDVVSPAVKKDLMVAIIRASGNDASAASGAQGGGAGMGLNVRIVFANQTQVLQQQVVNG